MKRGIRRRIVAAMLALFSTGIPLVAAAVDYTVSTVVGGGATAGCNSTPTVGTQLSISGPWTVATDNSGNIFYVDRNRYRVCKIAPNGDVTIFAGTGVQGIGGDNIQATTSMLYDPTTVATDSAGNVYIAEYQGSYAIRKVATDGVITTIFNTSHTNSHSGDGGLAVNATGINPSALAVAPNGDIYFSEYSGNYVRKIDTSGYISTVAGTGIAGSTGNGIAATSAQVVNVGGITVDPQGNVYLSQYNGCIRKITTSTGIISTFAGTCGTTTHTGDDGLATSATFLNLWQIASDSSGNIFVPERTGSAIRRIDAITGVVTTIAGLSVGSTDGLTSVAKFNGPFGVAVSPSGDLYVADTNNNKIRKILGAAVPQLTAPTLAFSGSAIFRSVISIAATSGSSGKITFYANGKKIPGCISRTYSGSLNCSWKPSIRGSITVYAEISSSSTKIKSSELRIPVGNRSIFR